MSFRLKTILGIAFIETILLITLIWSGLGYLRSSNESQLVTLATTTSNLFAGAIKNAVIATDLATLESFASDIIIHPDIVYVRILQNDLVLAEKGVPEILNLPHQPDTSLDDVEHGVFDVRAEISESGISFGVIEMGFTTSHIEEVLSTAKRWASGIAILEVMLVAVFSFALGTLLTKQLYRLRLATERIAVSGPGEQIDVQGQDELAEVALAFNQMSSELADTYQDLHISLDRQKQMLAQSERNEAKNNAILEASLDALITIDSEGLIIDYNRVAEQTFGWSKKEILGQNMSDYIIPKPFREAHKKGMQKFLETGEHKVLNQRLELTALDKSGREFPVEIAISPLETDQGQDVHRLVAGYYQAPRSRN